MPKEDIQVDIPDKEAKEEKVIEDKAAERTSRKREQVEKMFIDHYGQEADSDALKTLVDREMASSKSFDKLIKQKKTWRTRAGEKVIEDGKGDGKKPVVEDDEIKSDFDKIRGIEKTKATKSFLQKLVKDYPEEFPTKEAITSAYDKIMGEYKESGDETRREDFATNFEKAFKISHPKIYEEEIKAKERKRLLEDDVDLPDGAGEDGNKEKKRERKFLGGAKVDPVKDWYKPKSN